MPICIIGGQFDLNRFKYQIDLTGTKDGVNLEFVIPDNCVPNTIQAYLNGQRLDKDIDYETYDIGAGSAYHNRLRFLIAEYAPQSGDLLTTDYVIYI